MYQLISNYRSLITVVLMLLTLVSCDHKTDDFVFDVSTEDYAMNDYYVDEYGNEGIVVYIGSAGSRKLAMVLSADEANLPWGPLGRRVCRLDTVPSYKPHNLSFPIAMLQSMKSIGVEQFPAQAWCDSKNHGEPYPRGSSWHLPTDYEYELFKSVYTLRDINNALKDIGAETLDTGAMYWTCVEDYEGYIHFSGTVSDYDPENRAVVITPRNASYTDKDRWIKQNKYRVRAVKYVYWK